MQSFEVLAPARDTQVLEHTDGGDLVERGVALDRAIVPMLDAGSSSQPVGPQRLRRVRRLCFRQRDADDVGVVTGGSPADEPSPATPDVEEPFARHEPELSAYE